MTAGKILVAVSATPTPCGVESFARRLDEACGEDATEIVLTGRFREAKKLSVALRGARALVLNFPVVAWKRMLLTPLFALLVARAWGVPSVVIIHEWTDLAPARRFFVRLYAALASHILFSSPTVRAAYGRAGGVVPIPPNLKPPLKVEGSSASSIVAAARAQGRFILGHFGSIYPRKQSGFVFEVAAELRRRGMNVVPVFVGSFIRGHDQVEEEFRAKAAETGFAGEYLVTGYLATEAEIFGIFNEVDSFVYSFAEGLTSRRGSVLACLESGKPTIVNAPQADDEFEAHPTYRALLAEGALRLVPTQATAADYADAILSPWLPPPARPHLFEDAWADAASALRTALSAR